MPRVAMTIAGSDSSGGAGIQADLKTFTAFGVYGTTVITALTAQNSQGVSAIHGVPPGFVADQFDAVMTDMPVAAIKTGMLGEAQIVREVAACLNRHADVPVVVDPVMVATSGAILLRPEAIDAVKRDLTPRAQVITPNQAEAATLLGVDLARTLDEQIDQAKALMALGSGAVLVKGGHMDDHADESIDVLISGESVEILRGARIATRNTHGTGCTLSAAIAAQLARGEELVDAVTSAKAFVAEALASAAHWTLVGEAGPINHFTTASHSQDKR